MEIICNYNRYLNSAKIVRKPSIIWLTVVIVLFPDLRALGFAEFFALMRMGSLVVKTPSTAGGTGFIPGQGIKIMVQPKKKSYL